MAKQKAGADIALIEKLFDQLSPSVAVALLKDDKLAYEYYGGGKPGGRRGGKPGGRLGGRPGGGSGDRKAAGKAPSKGPDAGVGRTTRFNIGSASTLFTGALVVKLMEFDEVKLSDSIRRFVPEFKFDGVTVHHLLTHTSGLGADPLPYADNLAAKKAFFRGLYEGLRQERAPGSKHDFFGYGYCVLADVVEKVSGQALEELASALLFMPLGMKHSAYGAASLRDNQYVAPWSHFEDRYLDELGGKLPTGHNGLYTTALDMVRFARMFLNGGEHEGKPVFLESSVDFAMREITGGRFMRTPLFMIKRNVDVFGCFSEKQSPETVAATGDTGGLLFVDPRRGIAGAALTNSTRVHSASRNYSDVSDILMSI